MKEVNDFILCHNTKNENRIKYIASPLVDTFKITEFWHFTIKKDGSFSYLANTSDITDYYWGSRFYLRCPIFKHPDIISPYILLSKTIEHEGYNYTQMEMKKKYNLQFPFIIGQIKGDSYHGFGFSTREPHFPLDSLCTNHLPALTYFCEYFMNETALIEQEMLKEHFDLGALLGPGFTQPTHFLPGNSILVKNFYGKLKSRGKKEVKLTRREKECLALFIEGKVYREIGEELGLSTRSIESYFFNIKGKLDCHTKSELFQYTKELQDFGLLRIP